MPDIKLVDEKINQVMSLLGLGRPSITEEQKAIIAGYMEQIKDPLIDAFWDAKVPNQYTVIIEDVAEKVNFKITVRKL